MIKFILKFVINLILFFYFFQIKSHNVLQIQNPGLSLVYLLPGGGGAKFPQLVYLFIWRNFQVLARRTLCSHQQHFGGF